MCLRSGFNLKQRNESVNFHETVACPGKQVPNALGIYCLLMYLAAVIGTPSVVSIVWEAAKLPLLLILVAVSMWTLSRTPTLKALVRKV